MKTTLMAFVALTTLPASATAQNKKSPELKVLDRFVGTWDVQITSKPPGGGNPRIVAMIVALTYSS